MEAPSSHRVSPGEPDQSLELARVRCGDMGFDFSDFAQRCRRKMAPEASWPSRLETTG